MLQIVTSTFVSHLSLYFLSLTSFVFIFYILKQNIAFCLVVLKTVNLLFGKNFLFSEIFMLKYEYFLGDQSFFLSFYSLFHSYKNELKKNFI